MSTLWDGADLTALLTLERLDEDRFRATCSEANLGGEIFGGQYLGQGLAAALATTDPDRVPHSFTAYFLRAARADRELIYEVERTRDGRRFSHRQVVARQGGALAFRAEVSILVPGIRDWEHASAKPPRPDPESLPDLGDLPAVRADPKKWAVNSQLNAKPGVHLRPVDGETGFGRQATEARSACWVLAKRFVPADPRLGCCALAYLSDYWGNFASRLPFTAQALSGDTGASTLNHSLWFHAPVKGDDWLLFEVDSPASANGTGFNRGLVFDRAGRLVASQAQEALYVRR